MVNTAVGLGLRDCLFRRRAGEDPGRRSGEEQSRVSGDWLHVLRLQADSWDVGRANRGGKVLAERDERFEGPGCRRRIDRGGRRPERLSPLPTLSL